MTSREQVLEEWEHQKLKWGLSAWELSFSDQKRHLGYCRPKKRVISISCAFMEKNPFPIIRDTLLHEIAHALHFLDSGKTDHSNAWKKYALKVGCKPKRCADNEGLNMPEGNYVGVCPACNRTTNFYRKVRRSYSCSHCTKKYDPKFRLVIMSITDYRQFKRV